MNALLLTIAFIPLSFSALLPVINPIGSAVLFLGFVQDTDHLTRRKLARKIAVDTVLFLLIVLVAGTPILRFFGVSLPIVQVAGGLVLAAMGWSLLTKEETNGGSVEKSASASDFQDKIFYPLTFPITAGPGTVVVTLTLSAHASRHSLLETALAHLGVLIGIVLVSVTVYIAYAYADRTTARLSRSVTVGILRIISFILVCIGAQIMWNGIESLAKVLH